MYVTNKFTKMMKSQLLLARLKFRDFTIVSNNCWGTHIYQFLGEPYKTPFVGLFLTPSCYITLIPRLRWFLAQPIYFVKTSRYDYINALREKQKLKYPIGCLGGDVEIQFLHYGSEKDAEEKWSRRVERMSRDDSRLFFKFCDRDECTVDQLMAFDNLPFGNKVCFVSKPSLHMGSAVWIPGCSDGQVADGLQLSKISPRYFDSVGWLNGSDGKPKWWLPSYI
jgi:uncharacterized protein (DUF1919 family)